MLGGEDIYFSYSVVYIVRAYDFVWGGEVLLTVAGYSCGSGKLYYF